MNDPSAQESGTTLEAAVTLANEHLHRGEPVLAYNAAQSGLATWPGHVRLRQLQGLALARSGDVEGANVLLAKLAEEGHGDAETLSMLARTHKDLALAAKSEATRRQHLKEGFRLYARAFEDAGQRGSEADAYYSGINAATMAVLKGELDRARGLAHQVRAICEHASPAADGDGTSRYWREATLGEAALIIGDVATAAAHYAHAVELAGTRFGDVSSTRRQYRLLAMHLPDIGTACADALRVPPVLVFTGNMIDRPDRATPRFPAVIEAAVRSEVATRLAALRPVAVYGSAACGTDILCLEAARELGCETHVVLPFPAEQFRGSSVDFARGNWGERFERALAAADSVTVASDHRASGSAATFEYANLILTGMGELRAEALDTSLHGLAVWDPRVPGSAGGAASLVSLWERRGLAVENVHPHWFHERPIEVRAGTAEPAADARSLRHEMRALLFADAVGYSQLSEDQIPGFIGGFLEAVAALNRRTAHRFEHVETTGDGLYMVFRDVRDAGRYALELSALMRGSDRKAWGLPASFDLRIAVHCGPVHCGRDPVTGGNLYTGPHASRAARIEPITPPGQVYASSAFAAVAAATGVDGVTMRYVGRIPLAKSYGTLGLYCVRSID
jgi:hypothetical protein